MKTINILITGINEAKDFLGTITTGIFCMWLLIAWIQLLYFTQVLIQESNNFPLENYQALSIFGTIGVIGFLIIVFRKMTNEIYKINIPLVRE